jgi:hypothetical protein
MVQQCLRVLHPLPGAEVTALPHNHDGAPYYFLGVMGQARGFTFTRGNASVQLTKRGDANPLTIIDVQVVIQGMHWFVALARLPREEAEYTLSVKRTDANDPPEQKVTFKLKKPTAAVKAPSPVAGQAAPGGQEGYGGDIPIQFPSAGLTICPTFTATGSDGITGPPTSAAMSQGGVQVDAETPAPVPGVNGVWYCQFVGLPENSGYTLTASNSSDSGSKTNITLDSGACAGPPPGP